MDAPEKPRRSFGGLWGFLLAVLVVGLGAVVLYLSATINRQHYRLAAHEGFLVIERGRMLPMGFEPFVPEAEALKEAYAPIAIPEGETVKNAEVFDDRAELDRGIFMTLSGWARARLEAVTPEDFDLAVSYVQRAELLPGLSEEQRSELKILRADLAVRRGKRIVAFAVQELERAKKEFETAIRLGTPRAAEAERWLANVERRLDMMRQLPGLTPELVAPPATAPDPSVTPGASDTPDASNTPDTSAPERQPSSEIEPPRWRL